MGGVSRSAAGQWSSRRCRRRSARTRGAMAGAVNSALRPCETAPTAVKSACISRSAREIPFRRTPAPSSTGDSSVGQGESEAPGWIARGRWQAAWGATWIVSLK
eukprot:scaffold838_cov107-Isochrysis_galbana.AAC.3